MTAIIIIVIVIFVIFLASDKKQPVQQKITATNSNSRKKTEKEMKEELVQALLKNIKVSITTSDSTNTDDSIIDVTNQSYKIQPSNNLKKYNGGVPYWGHHYVYSHTELNSASEDQKSFYSIFKAYFFNGEHFDLEGNTNYAFILLFDLLNEYDTHKDILKLESQINTLGRCYPKTKVYGTSFLIQKMELNGYSNDASRLRADDRYSYQNFNSGYDYLGLGTKYRSKLNLTGEEVELLNRLPYAGNNFLNIEFCHLEVLKLYVAVITALKVLYKNEGTTLEKEFFIVADVVAKKHYRYRAGSQNYKYSIESITNEFYTTIFKYCENAVRNAYEHKRKLNTDHDYTNVEAKSEFETKIISKVSELLPTLTSTITSPDNATEIELNAQTTSRWKMKFEKLTADYKNNSASFTASIIELGKLNKKNPSIENIFFEASKFLAKYDKQSSLTLYVHYLYHDLKSSTFDNKQLTKTVQKNLFRTNEQLHHFEKIISNLIKDKDLDKALEAVPKVYEAKRKKIQLDKTTIKEVQQQHSGTVELLNEYLRDDFEDEINAIQAREINSEEIKIEITQKNEEPQRAAFLTEIPLTAIHVSILELFSKNNFSILQREIEDFAKPKGFLKNQAIESINEACYEILDDVLIEEDEDYYTIIPAYFQKISAK
jgi:hypothetical protein